MLLTYRYGYARTQFWSLALLSGDMLPGLLEASEGRYMLTAQRNLEGESVATWTGGGTVPSGDVVVDCATFLAVPDEKPRLPLVRIERERVTVWVENVIVVQDDVPCKLREAD